jgi:polyisoprenoid-binding protein YceI
MGPSRNRNSEVKAGVTLNNGSSDYYDLAPHKRIIPLYLMVSYQIDSKHTGVHFKVRHMMISNVMGEFSHVAGSVEFDPSNLAASHVEAAIEAATVSTREPQRDKHLKSADFLDVKRYPTITFRSTKIVSGSGDSYEVAGDVTLHGVTRDITLQVEALTPEIKDTDGSLRRGASATTRIQRSDFGLRWNAVLESGGFVVGDDVEITIDVELVRKEE